VRIEENYVINDGLGPIELHQVAPFQWEVVKDFNYTTASGKTIDIPAGFVTDGASSPLRILIASVGGKYSTAAIIHDRLYAELNYGTPDVAAPTREEADAMLFEIMDKTGVNFWVKWAMWLAVRAGGGPLTRWIGVRQ